MKKLFVFLTVSIVAVLVIAQTKFPNTVQVPTIIITNGSPSSGKVWIATNSTGAGFWGTPAAGGGGSALTTNANQFLGVPLSIPQNAKMTNISNYGLFDLTFNVGNRIIISEQTPTGQLIESGVDINTISTNVLVQTNGVNVGSVGTINWTAGVTGSVSGAKVTLGVSAAGGSGTPAGSNFEVQYNSAGAFAASSNFRFLPSGYQLQIVNPVSSGEVDINGEGFISQSTGGQGLAFGIGSKTNLLINAEGGVFIKSSAGRATNLFQVENTNLVPIVTVSSNGNLNVLSNIVVGGSVSTGQGAVPGTVPNGAIILYDTNGTSSTTITRAPNWLTTNTLAFSITNPVAGQVLKISSVTSSGGNVTSVITNDVDASGSGTNQIVQTNGVNMGQVGTINWTAGVTGSVSGAVATLGVAAASVEPQSTNFFRYVATTNVVSITVQSIPQTWNTIEVSVWGRASTNIGNDTAFLRVNDNAGAIYYREYMLANAASLTSALLLTETGLGFGGFTASNSLPTMASHCKCSIPEYANGYYGKSATAISSMLRNTNSTVFANYFHQASFIDSVLPITNLVIYTSGQWATGSVFNVTLRK